MNDRPDSGLRAVARVRGVRELDSRLGLRHALAEESSAASRVTAIEATLGSRVFRDGDVASFLAVQASGRALAADASRAREALATARTVTTAAQDHWQDDRTRLRAVEWLLERRAEERRQERERREVREIDDLVAARWLRIGRTEGAPS